MMRAARSGDASAYKAFLESAAPVLRASARKNLMRLVGATNDVEDIVQETLLAIHLKRHTWDTDRPIRPWIAAIAHNKLIDAMRRRGRRIEVPVEDIGDLPASDECPDTLDRRELEHLLESLSERQREIVRSLSLNGASVRETAERLSMSEGAVRVSLHRALGALAALYRKDRK